MDPITEKIDNVQDAVDDLIQQLEDLESDDSDFSIIRKMAEDLNDELESIQSI